MESWHVLIESLVSSASFDHGNARLQVTVVSIWANKIKVVFDMHDWNGDVLIVNADGNTLVKVILSSWSEMDWSLLEEDVDLLLNLPLANLVVLNI